MLPRPFAASWTVLARASHALRRALVWLLLVAAYVTVLPPLALARRWSRRPAPGWRPRHDPLVGTRERLRARF